jgi:hypothetical protein
MVNIHIRNFDFKQQDDLREYCLIMTKQLRFIYSTNILL